MRSSVPQMRMSFLFTQAGRTAIVMAVLTLIAVLALIQIDSFRDARALRLEIDRKYDQQFALGRLMSLLQDVETGQRGYTLTGKEEFLQPYTAAVAQFPRVLEDLDRLTTERADRERLGRLRLIGEAKIRFTEEVVAVRRSGDAQAAAAIVAGGRGRRTMDLFRQEMAAQRGIDNAQVKRLLGEYADTNLSSRRWTIAIQLLLFAMLASAFRAYAANVERLREAVVAARDISTRQVAIFAAANEAMIVADPSGAIDSVNPAAERLFQRPQAELLKGDVHSLFVGDLFIAGESERRSRDREGPTLRTLQGVRSDGTRFDAETASSIVHLEEGNRTLLLIRDATERNRVERMKTEFVSTVSHELRTPLTSIRGAIALLEHRAAPSLDGQNRQLLGIANANAQRLSALIDDILDIEKINSGSMDYDMHRVDLRDLVTEAADQNRTYAADRDIRIEVEVAARPIMVDADAGRIIQVMSNLISNAAKFSPPGAEVTLRVEGLDQHAFVCVIDRGSGIPVEFRPHLFDRFSQARGSRRATAGTGLGLAIAKAIVERHGGLLGYESDVGKGTTFWIELPMAMEAAA